MYYSMVQEGIRIRHPVSVKVFFMVLDIFFGAVIVAAMVFGYRNGFVRTVFHTLSWLLSLILAFLLTPRLRDHIVSGTEFYDSLNESITERLDTVAGAGNLSADLPRILRYAVDDAAHQAVSAVSASISYLLVTIISFLIIVFAAKLVFFVVMLALSKKYVSGARGFFDGVAGLVFGFVKGALLVFILLVVMIPFLSLFDSGLTETVGIWLDSSYFAGSLYDNNFLALIVRDFLL